MTAQPIAAVVMSSPTRNASRLLAYVRREKPGQAAGTRYVAASGLNGAIPEVAMQQFRDNRKKWGKDGQRQVAVKGKDGLVRTLTEGQFVQGYHLIQSFARDGEGALDPHDPKDQETAHRLGRKLGARLAGKGRHAVVVTQIDGVTGCLHNHIVIDSIDRQTGRSFDSSAVKHKVLVATHDTLLAEAGYEQQNKLASTAAERREPSEVRARLRPEQWLANGKHDPEPFSVAVMKDRIREGLADSRSVSFEAYAEVLAERGVRVERRGQDHAGLTYEMVLSDGQGSTVDPQPAHRRRASKLGRDFMVDSVEQACERNRSRAAAAPSPRPHRPLLDPNKYLGLFGGAAQDPTPSPAVTATPNASEADRPLLWSLYEREGLDWRKTKRAPETDPEPALTPDAVEPAPAPPVPVVEPVAGSTEPEDEAEALEPQDGVQEATAPAYRSPVRDRMVKRERDREFRERLAAADEHVVERLQAGEPIDDAMVKGLGPEKVRPYRTSLHPQTQRALRRRQSMQAAAAQAYSAGDRERAQQLRTQVAAGEYRWIQPAGSTEAQRDRDEPELGG